MGVLFILLAFVAFIAFFVALIRPSWVKMKSRKQSSAILGGSFVFLIVVGTVLTPPVEQAIDTVAAEPTPVSIASAEIAQPAPVEQPKPKSRDQLIAGKIESSLGVQTNMSKPRVVSVEITNYKQSELSAYKYASTDTVQSVLVKVNGSENLTSNLQKMTLHKEASQIFQDIFSSFPQVGDVIIWERLPVSDQYGNKTDDTAIVYAMGRPLYDKINWASYQYAKLPDLLKSEGRIDDRNSYYEAIRF